VDGILNICKPAGMSSNKCMSIVKRKLGLKKVGFLGTLDPLASGVLVLLCGRATKLADKLHQSTKVYRSVFTFGIETDTLDSAGQVIARSNSGEAIPNGKQIKSVLPSMIGDIEIEIPRFSAVHINGKRAYDLARARVDFVPPKKTVKIKRFELLSELKHLELCRTEKLGKNEFYFEIECETGTYIRSLAKLLAQKLGTVAIASSIIRTRVGDFDIKEAKSLQDVTTNDIMLFQKVC